MHIYVHDYTLATHLIQSSDMHGIVAMSELSSHTTNTCLCLNYIWIEKI